MSLSREEIAALQEAHEADCAEAAPRNWKGELIDGDVETPETFTDRGGNVQPVEDPAPEVEVTADPVADDDWA